MTSRKLSPLVPRHQKVLVALLIMVSVIDSVLVGFDSSLMGSLNVMPSYSSYFTLTTATKSLNTAISYLGGIVVSPIAGFLVDYRGRKESIFYSCALTLIGGVIQGSAQNIGMFIAGRFIVGMGMGLAQTAAPTLVAETVPVKFRGFALGLYYACWSVGTLIAAGVCYGTQNIDTTWAWRIPSLLQAVPSIVCFVLLLFIPESPRWLISRDRHDEAIEILTIANAANAEEVQVQWREITDTLAFEKEHSKGLVQSISTKSARKRLLITTTFSIMVMLPGTNIITYFFGDMLSGAGITDPNTQLEINLILTAWTLVVAVISSWYADALPRKWLCSISLGLQTASLFIFGGLTDLYGSGSNLSGVYGTIALIFLYNAFYAWGITPLTVLYPPEVLSFDIRGVGMGLYTLATKACGLLVGMAVPFGLAAIGWKFYMVNSCFNVLMIVFVVFVWVETRGLSLEEVDKLFDKVKHETVVQQVEQDLKGDITQVSVVGKV